MALFYRLRRSVALFICPEMGVEARLMARREHAVSGAGLGDTGAAMRAARERRAERFAFFDTDWDASLAARRHRNLERSKKVLKVIEQIQLRGLPGEDDPAFDLIAQDLSISLFGKP